MADSRRWYTEPETFIAVAALVVSISAVVVGIYEASLQRHHDKAEVWPHLEIGVFTNAHGAIISLQSTGIGPAIVQSAIVTVDGRPGHNWSDVLGTLNKREPVALGNYSVVGHGLRPGDQVNMVQMPPGDQPMNFWTSIARVGVLVCYASVFDEYWTVESKSLGNGITWHKVARCPPQPDSTEF